MGVIIFCQQAPRTAKAGGKNHATYFQQASCHLFGNSCGLLLPVIDQELNSFRVLMAQEKALSPVKPGDGLHIFLGKSKIKDVEILLHPFPAGRLRNGDNSTLNQEPQGCLRRGLAVFLSNALQHGVGEKPIATFRKRPPGFYSGTVLFHYFTGLFLLVEHMRFHLVDGGPDLAELRQIHKAVRIKIAYADGTDLSGPVRFFPWPGKCRSNR